MGAAAGCWVVGGAGGDGVCRVVGGGGDGGDGGDSVDLGGELANTCAACGDGDRAAEETDWV